MTFRPLNSSNKYSNNMNQINEITRQLTNEQTVKVFKGANNVNAVITGKYADNSYGLVVSDTAGDRRILVGQHPVDGRPIIAISIEGVDVIDELST